MHINRYRDKAARMVLGGDVQLAPIDATCKSFCTYSHTTLLGTEGIMSNKNESLPEEQCVPLKLKSYNKKRSSQTELFREVSPINICDIFSYNYDRDDLCLFGAKAVSYKTVTGKIEVFFFSQGVGRVENNVHHRDVFSAILELELDSPEFKSYRKVLEIIAELYPMNAPDIYEAAERIFSSASGGPDLGRRFVDEVVKCKEWDDAFIPLLELPERLANLATLVKQRSNHELEADSMFGWIFAAQGYQFSARKSASGLIIENAKIDSSINSLQKKYPDSTSPALYKEMNEKVLSNISPSLRRFRDIEIPSEFKAN